MWLLTEGILKLDKQETRETGPQLSPNNDNSFNHPWLSIFTKDILKKILGLNIRISLDAIYCLCAVYNYYYICVISKLYNKIKVIFILFYNAGCLNESFYCHKVLELKCTSHGVMSGKILPENGGLSSLEISPLSRMLPLPCSFQAEGIRPSPFFLEITKCS